MSAPANDHSKSKPGGSKKIDLKQIALLLFAVLNMGGLGGALWMVFSHTIGWQPPLIIEEELRKPQSVTEGHAATNSAKGDGSGHGSTKEVSLIVPEFDELTAKFDPFVANLEGEPKRVIKLVISFKVLDDESYEELLDPVRVPKVRDGILDSLQKTNFNDIESLQGKLFLKDRLIKVVNSIMDKGVVRDIYFTEFVVQ